MKAVAPQTGQLAGATSDVCCVGRAPTEDELRGIQWWNGQSETARRFWLDSAWRRNQKASGRTGYSIEDMPSAADAWAAYKAFFEVSS